MDVYIVIEQRRNFYFLISFLILLEIIKVFIKIPIKKLNEFLIDILKCKGHNIKIFVYYS